MELRQYVRILRQYLWLLLILPIIGGGVAYYTSFREPTVYEAMTTLEITVGQSALENPYTTSSARSAGTIASVFAAKLQSPTFLNKVRERLALTINIQGMIVVKQVGETQFLDVTARSSDQGLSQALANAAAIVFIEEESDQQEARFRQQLTEIEQRITALDEAIAETELAIVAMGPESELGELERMDRAQLESQLNRDQTRRVVLMDSVEEFRLAMTRSTDYMSIYTSAEMATSAIRGETVQNTLLGASGGLIIAASLAFLLEYLDDSIRTPEDITRALSLDVLGALPRSRRANGTSGVTVVENPLEPVSEAFRNLRTSLRFSTLDHPSARLLVTSPLPTEGKSFTAVNLAATMAQGGQSVILVDTDLRHPTIQNFLEMEREPGLTAALLSPDRRGETLRATGIEGLSVVTVGEHVHNPAELLGSQAFGDFLDWLATQADVLVLDSPPVLPVADTSMLAALVDKVLLICDYKVTTRSAARQALDRLRSVGGDVVGAVLNRLEAGGDGYYYYYYYGYPPEENKGLKSVLANPFGASRLRKRRGRKKTGGAR